MLWGGNCWVIGIQGCELVLKICLVIKFSSQIEIMNYLNEKDYIMMTHSASKFRHWWIDQYLLTVLYLHVSPDHGTSTYVERS